MFLTVGQLRSLIRRSLQEAGGGFQRYPSIRDAQSPAMADREALGAQRMTDLVGDDELPPHLRNADEEFEKSDADLGPVPPEHKNDVFAMTDPYTKDWHVLPTPGR